MDRENAFRPVPGSACVRINEASGWRLARRDRIASREPRVEQRRVDVFELTVCHAIHCYGQRYDDSAVPGDDVARQVAGRVEDDGRGSNHKRMLADYPVVDRYQRLAV